MSLPGRIALVVVGLTLVACGGADSADTSTTSSPSTSTTISPTTTAEDELPQDSNVVDAAIADLAARLDIAPEDVEVVEARSVQWPDGALGCPEEGVLYTQALVDGTQVLLRVDERVYDYHAGSEGDVFLCESDR